MRKRLASRLDRLISIELINVVGDKRTFFLHLNANHFAPIRAESLSVVLLLHNDHLMSFNTHLIKIKVHHLQEYSLLRTGIALALHWQASGRSCVTLDRKYEDNCRKKRFSSSLVVIE